MKLSSGHHCECGATGIEKVNSGGIISRDFTACQPLRWLAIFRVLSYDLNLEEAGKGRLI